ncbi:Aste57867_12515 [Aphanomyces stellatus]|uniref:Aste57867_12515 protein n=1 Tax=Aphanomyces stellatus TaxID=120398 RepID=A0A485KVS1_9STRA|nr:hypothetical protein As57867_012469 [Aphanomyces stellatus]VFT89366.1 Aste57867_12515 [Aphanomyces stellatus]
MHRHAKFHVWLLMPQQECSLWFLSSLTMMAHMKRLVLSKTGIIVSQPMAAPASPKKPIAAFALASKASRRQMWRRELEAHDGGAPSPDPPGPRNPYDCITHILPSELDPYEEKRLFASRTVRGSRPARAPEGRRPYGVKQDQIENNIPHAIYNTDHGDTKSLSTGVHDSTLSYATAFKSKKNRFASVPAYKMSSFASVVKEPYAHPEEMGPGTYRVRLHTLRIKDIYDETYTFSSNTSRFTTPRVAYKDNGEHGNSPVKSSLGKPQIGTVAVSQTPRFTSETAFPENYASSKQQRVFPPPDIVYDKPILRNTIQDAVDKSHVKYGVMTSNADRLVSTASMVHNVPGAPKLHGATTDKLGPGAYKNQTQFVRADPQDKGYASILPTEHTKDRFGMKPIKNATFVEARFRRFCPG